MIDRHPTVRSLVVTDVQETELSLDSIYPKNNIDHSFKAASGSGIQCILHKPEIKPDKYPLNTMVLDCVSNAVKFVLCSKYSQVMHYLCLPVNA